MATKTVRVPETDDHADMLSAVDEGLVDAKAGRTVEYEKVRRWLLTWGNPKELPPPKSS